MKLPRRDHAEVTPIPPPPRLAQKKQSKRGKLRGKEQRRKQVQNEQLFQNIETI